MGRKTSVYLTDDLAVMVAASGLSLSAHVRRSCESASLAGTIRAVVREELDRAAPLTHEHESVPAVDAPVPMPVRASSDEGRPAGLSRTRTAAASSVCTHPRARVHKGLCGACGQHVTPG